MVRMAAPSGYFAPDDLEVAITIRSVVLKDGTAFVHAGAGIVADSVPARESAEVAAKAGAVLAALATPRPCAAANADGSRRHDDRRARGAHDRVSVGASCWSTTTTRSPTTCTSTC